MKEYKMSNCRNETNDFGSPEGISLKEYVNDRILALEKSIDTRFESVTTNISAALAAADKATSKAEVSAEKRFEGINELRGMATDQQRVYMPRLEAEILIKAMNEKIDSLNLTTISRQSKDVGQREGMGTIIGIASVVSIVVAILSRFIN